MKASQLDRFIGVPYDENSFDCADFVAWVMGELFGRTVNLPGARPRGVRGQLALGQLSQAYAARTEAPKDGDLVMMTDRGHKHAAHVGLYFWLDHEAWCLHSNETSKFSVLHRIKDLPSYGAKIEGFYSWI